MQKIVVTGGTGTLGKQVVKQLLAKGCEVNVLSSRDTPEVPAPIKVIRGNLATGEGLENLRDANIIVHCASNPKDPQNTDVAGTRRLLNALSKNNMAHFVNISIVGVDKSDYPYYQAKLAVENLISESGIPFTTLRATQFHDLVLNMIRSFEIVNETILVPVGMKFQSIEVNEVALRLAELVDEQAAGLLPDMGGPEILSIEEMVKIYLEVSGKPYSVAAKPIEGPRYELFRSGINLSPAHRYGSVTWEMFLASLQY